MKHLIAVGACYIDTILSVSHYPGEDEKLRATSLSKRRGGNCPNTLEVLQQLLTNSSSSQHTNNDTIPQPRQIAQQEQVNLVLASALPCETSTSTSFIHSSFSTNTQNPTTSTDQHDRTNYAPVDLTSYVFTRPDHEEAASSYIIKSQSTGSRTIVNFNHLPEMTLEEFKHKTEMYLARYPQWDDLFWYHFEGRVPETTGRCIEYLRGHPRFNSTEQSSELKISVELEKPNRDGLFALAQHADVVFYSKSWAIGQGAVSASDLLEKQARLLRENVGSSGMSHLRSQILVCTWGETGSSAMHLSHDLKSDVVSCPAWNEGGNIVDSVGAGDTFIAGMLSRFISMGKQGEIQMSMYLEESMRFANELAGRKIKQEGFSGLGRFICTDIKNDK